MKTKYVEIKEMKVNFFFIAEFGSLNGVQFHN